MSRGWESKSVESQQAEQESVQPAQSQAGSQPSPPKPATGNIAADAEQKRRIQALQLQRERILSERTSSPHRRSALGAALDSIEEELAQLGWTIHL